MAGIDTTSPHYKGKYASIYEVNVDFPNGGSAGDYVDILGFAHYWNPDRNNWCVNEERDEYWDALLQEAAQGVIRLEEKLNTGLETQEETTKVLQESIITLDTELKQADLATRKNKGYFVQLSELTENVPQAKNGDIAYIGNKYPYNIFRWKNGSWVDSGETGGEEVKSINNIGTINNPDDEDLVENNGVLKLKDRDTSKGMGYVILRTDKTFVEQATQPNTIYEIRYDFDLGGAEVEIPENCVIKFSGGSLRNGTLIISQAKIRAGLETIFFDMNFVGKFFDGYIHPEWFGAQGDGTTDDYAPLQKSIDLCKENSSKMLLTRNYYISQALEYAADDGSGYNPLKIIGNGISSSGIIFSGEEGIYIKKGVNCELDSFTIKGVDKNSGTGLKIGDNDTNYVVRSYFSNLYITNCYQCIYCWGWLNQFNNINTRFATNGILDVSTASVYNNVIVEQCYHGMTVGGIVVINGGTIEECIEGVDVNGGHITFNSVYFEGNSPSEGSANFAINELEQKYADGYHVKAGYLDRCSIIFNACTFHVSVPAPNYEHSRIFLDSVNNVLFNACRLCDVYTTENTGLVKYTNAVNEYDKFSTNPYTAFGSIPKTEGVSNTCFFELQDFSNLQQIVNNNIFTNSNYYDYYPLVQDSSLYLRLDQNISDKNAYSVGRRLSIWRKPGGKNRLAAIITAKDSFLANYSGKVSFELDIKFIRNIPVKMSFAPNYSCLNGSQTLTTTTPKTNLIRQDLGNAIKTFVITVNLDELRQAALDAGLDPSNNQYRVNFFAELDTKVSAIEEGEEDLCRIELMRIGLFEGAYKNNHGAIADISKRAYEECGCLVPEQLFLPKEKDIESLRGRSAIYNKDEYLIGVKGENLKYIQKISTGSRPNNPPAGFQHFEGNKPIWWTGTTWVDATGATV